MALTTCLEHGQGVGNPLELLLVGAGLTLYAARPALPVIEAAAASDQEYLRNAGRYLAAVLKGVAFVMYAYSLLPEVLLPASESYMA